MYRFFKRTLTYTHSCNYLKRIFALVLILSGFGAAIPVLAQESVENGYERYRNASIRELHDIGLAYFNAQKLDSASMVLTIATTKENSHLSEQDAAMLAVVHNVLGVINFTNANYAGAYSHFLRGIKIYDVPDAPGYANLAAVYLYYGDTSRAYECLKKVFKTAVERNHTYHASISLVNILSLDLDNSMIPVDSIRGLITDFRSIPNEHRDKRGFPVADAMAVAYLLSHSGRHLESAIKLKGLLGNLGRMVLPARDIHTVYSLIAKEYTAANMPDSALLYLDRAQYIATVNDFKELLASTYGDKSILLAETGRLQEAEKYRIKRLEMNDSLFNPRELGKIRDIQMSYETNVFEKRLDMIRVKEHMWKIIFIISAVALLVVTVMMVLLYRKNRAIRDKNEHLFRRTTRYIEEEGRNNKSMIRSADDIETVDEDMSADSVQETPENSVGDDNHLTSGAIPSVITEMSDGAVKEIEHLPEDEREDNEEGKRKYTSSALTDETRRLILEKINRVFDDESLFCQENFSLQTLAQLCDTNQRYASQIINETMGINFASLLNEKRIKVACQRLMDTDKYGNLTIEAVIADLGFKSRSTFSKTFKRITGLTPGEFQRLAKQK